MESMKRLNADAFDIIFCLFNATLFDCIDRKLKVYCCFAAKQLRN